MYFNFNMPEMTDSPAGAKVKNTYKRVENHLEKTGEMNLYDYIQSFREQTDYTTLLEKMSRGDAIATAKVTQILADGEANPKQYGGVDDNSQTLQTVFASIQKSKSVYDQLGGQEKLGLSFKEFLSYGEIVSGQKPAEPAAAAEVPEGGAE